MNKNDLLGFLLGDSYISPKGVLTTRHSYKQKEYLEFKYKYCQELYPDRNFSLVDVPLQDGIQFGISDASTFSKWREEYYPNGKKIISIDWLKKLSKQAIAFWFCDDGSSYYKKYKGNITAIESVISTCCSEAEVDIIISYFKEFWNVKMSKKKDKNLYSLRFGTKEGRKFADLFGSHIPGCMKWKISKFEDFKGKYIQNKI